MKTLVKCEVKKIREKDLKDRTKEEMAVLRKKSSKRDIEKCIEDLLLIMGEM